MCKTFYSCDVDFQEVPALTIKQTCDCLSGLLNAIASAIKGSSVNDVEEYIKRVCEVNQIPAEVCIHMCRIVSLNLYNLGYE